MLPVWHRAGLKGPSAACACRTWSVPRVTTTGQMQSRESVMEKDWIATGLKLRMRGYSSMGLSVPLRRPGHHQAATMHTCQVTLSGAGAHFTQP